MIPTPNLDDRKFEDIVDEAIRLIPQYCPEWTNFNASDPGITLIELFAWMMEMALYRLNRVPDKNYLAFLELMGVTLQPPQPARALLTFKLSDKTDSMAIPRGSAFSTKAGAGSRAIAFETEEDLTVVNSVLDRVIVQEHDRESGKTLITNVTEDAKGGRGGFNPFVGTRAIDRYIYLGDPRLENFNEAAVLTVQFNCPHRGDREMTRLLEWEYWNGERWRELYLHPRDVDYNAVAFMGPPTIAKSLVNDTEEYWLRGRLIEVPRSAEETTVETIVARLEISGEGVPPDRAIANVDGDLFLPRDMDRNFLPFDREPRVDAMFYVACESILSQEGATIEMEVQLSDPSVAEAPVPSQDLKLRWEFWNGKKWTLLGRTTQFGVPADEPGWYGFVDGTNAFTKSGTLSFQRPKTLEATRVNDEDGMWLRVRVEQGDYGVPGAYENVEDRWVWRDERPLRPPTFKALAFRFSEEPRPFKNCMSFNDFVFTDHTATAASGGRAFQAFQPVAEESPTIYLGFKEPFPNATCQIYFHTVDESSGGNLPGRSGAWQRRQPRAVAELEGDTAEQRVVWEYWAGKSWSPLLPHDWTDNFTQSGFMQFVGPKDLRTSKRFGDNLYWLRARLEMGGYDVPPRIERIVLNSVYSLNISTVRDTLLGTSQGTPNQRFTFPRTPVLDGQRVVVRERERPSQEEIDIIIAEEGDEAFRQDPETSSEYLVTWHQVDNLYDSGPRSRHYIKDTVTSEILFGDGNHGMVPPKGDKNIIASSWQVGGGVEGNVAAETITVMKQSFSYLDSVSNLFPATGGCDLETVDDAKMRGPHMLKSRNRAVTAEDFEWLSREASNSVARVKALPSTDREGQVTVIVVPKLPRLLDGTPNLLEKPIPSTELLRRVRTYLNERKLLTTIVNVVKPRYVEMSVEVRIVRRSSGSSDRIKRDIQANLWRFLNPLVGGRDAKGWPFGRAVFKVDLYHVIENVDGVDFVDMVRIVDSERRTEVEQLRLAPDELPHLVGVEVVEKAHERIV